MKLPSLMVTSKVAAARLVADVSTVTQLMPREKALAHGRKDFLENSEDWERNAEALIYTRDARWLAEVERLRVEFDIANDHIIETQELLTKAGHPCNTQGALAEGIGPLVEERDESRAEIARLRAALEKVIERCICKGTGKRAADCEFCDDSGQGHECTTALIDCTRRSCVEARAALTPVTP